MNKFSASQIFDGYTFLPAKTVIITDAEGEIRDIIPMTDAGDNVQLFDGILTPGFVNCHCHLELSHMKGVIPEGIGLPAFLAAVMKHRNIATEQITEAIEKAEDEMLANGIVAVGDICNLASTIPQKLKGRIWYHNFIEATGFNSLIADQRFKRCVDFFSAFSQLYSIPIESNSIVPHAPYSVSDELWKKIIHFPGNHLLTIHNQESQGENDWFQYKKGKMQSLFDNLKMDASEFKATGQTSLQSFLPRFIRNQSVILVHNVFTSQPDIEFAKSSGLSISWCLCPNANQYISAQLPSVDMFMKNDCLVTLGTDSLASNHQLSILSEIQTLRKAFPAIAVDQLLRFATSNGAKALQMDQLLGSFEKGKRPGLLLLDKDLSQLRRLL